MPEQTEKENVLSRRLNKVLETRLENDQVIISLLLKKIAFIVFFCISKPWKL